MTDASLATIIGRIVILTVVVAAIGFGVVGFVLLFSDDDATVTEQPHPPRTQHPSSSDRSATQPIPTTTPVRPEYNLQKSERDTPIYINYNVDAAEESITDAVNTKIRLYICRERLIATTWLFICGTCCRREGLKHYWY
jgi:hypothetical protein